MSESEGATLNTDRDYNTGDPPNHGNPIGAASILGTSKPSSVDGSGQLKKWRKIKVRKEDISCKESHNVVNHLAVKIEVKKETGSCDKRKLETLPALQNGGEDLVVVEEFVCRLCGIKYSTAADLDYHTIHDHVTACKQKSAKPPKIFRPRVQHYCFACNGRTFGSKLSLLRHIAQHVSLPVVRVSRLEEPVEERPYSPVIVPSGRPQVALKRVTVSCHARSPLKFRLKLTGDPNGKDSFKLVKAVNENVGQSTVKSVVESLSCPEKNAPDDCEKISEVEAFCGPEVIDTVTSEVEREVEGVQSVVEEERVDSHCATDAEVESAMVEASQEQCTVPIEEESVVDSPKDSASCRNSPGKEIVSENIEEEIMRQMKNGEGEMEKIQSSSPSVIQNPRGSRKVTVDERGFISTTVDGSESLEPEFIPIERLDKDTAAQIIENSGRENLLDDSLSASSKEKVSETHILCEACGESILGDQTALEDHCLCRGHFKCPICSVACASTDALAVHSKETHQEITMQPVERKKKGHGLRSVRRKHQEQKEREAAVLRDSLSELSNSSSQSPNAEATLSHTPPTTSPSTTKPSESSQPDLNMVISEVTHVSSRVPDRRQSPSQQSNTSSPVVPQPVADFSQAIRASQHPNSHVRPPRVSESMPPPLIRPPNPRILESQAAHGNVPNVRMTDPLQPPPALYKMPTTSHGINNSQMGPAVSTVSTPGYARGIPASGYQPAPQSSIAAALNARYQSMHHGYPSASQPPSSYAPYPQSVQMQQAQMMQQQRFPMGPPPPYPSQMHHMQQGSRVSGMSQEAFNLATSQQAYGQSLLKAHLEQARMQLPQPSAMLQSMQNLQQEHYQQQQLQQQLFQQPPPHHQMMQPQQHEQSQSSAPPPQHAGQKRKGGTAGASAGLRYHQQTALNNQQNLQSQLQQSAPTPAKQRRIRDNIGIPSKQTDSDCEIIAVQQRGEGVPVIQSIQGSNSSTGSSASSPVSDLSNASTLVVGTPQVSPESTIHLTDSITLSVRQPPGSSSAGTSGHRGHNANAVASILATRGITVTPASGSVQHPRSNSGQHRSRPSPPLNRGPATSPPQQSAAQQPSPLNNAISISHSSRQHASQAQHSNDGFAMPAPVGPAPRAPQRQQAPADRPPRPPTVDLTDENAAQAQAQALANVCQCRLCDKQFPSMEALQNHMQLIHQTRNYFRCTICNTKHPSQQALANHVKRVHKFSGNGPPLELVIPLVDLRNTASMNRLSSLGIRHVISLSQLGMNPDSGSFCIPIMSLDPSGQQRNNSIGGLMSLGTTAVLPIGPVKSLPSVPQSSQSAPQTVPSSQPSVPPPLAPIRSHPPNQYVQPPPHQLPPR